MTESSRLPWYMIILPAVVIGLLAFAVIMFGRGLAGGETNRHSLENVQRAAEVRDCILMLEVAAPPEIARLPAESAFEAAHVWCSQFVHQGGRPDWMADQLELDETGR